VQRAGRVPGELRRQLLQHLKVFRRLEALSGNDGLAADLVERVFEFGQPVGRVDVDQHGPDARSSKLRQQPLDPVWRPDADAIALADAAREQTGGKHIDLLHEHLPRPADTLLAEHHGGSVREAPGGIEQKLSDGRVTQWDSGRAAHVGQTVLRFNECAFT
jgi:hypothetical protein